MTALVETAHRGRFASADVELLRLPGGVIELRSKQRPTDAPATTLHWLHRWAATTPSAILLTEVADGGRLALDYGSAWDRVVQAARALIARGIGQGVRVAVIAQNGIDAFVAGHAVMLAGAVWVPIAPQYLRPGADPARIASVLEMVGPALVVVPDESLHEAVPVGYRVETTVAGDGSGRSAGDAGLRLLDRCLADDPAKLLLTSGSTGTPKAVVYTHRMLVNNVRATVDVWPFVDDHPPVLVDWLPWNHAFGGNANLNMVLLGGGTIHIDDAHGRPDALHRTIAAIREFSPTFHAAVPATFQALVPVLEADRGFRTALFGRCDALFSAGAGMPVGAFRRLKALSQTVRELPVPVLTGWGSTEVGPGATIVHSADSEPGWVGPPLPGVTIRLVPVGDKLELRVRSESVTPGYWRDPDRTAAVFDHDGFYRSGDAGRLVDDSRPELGLRFDGRIADDFKLSNGSWVNVDRLRSSLLALAGNGVRDVVVAGPDRAHLVALFWVTEGATVDVGAVLAAHNAGTTGQTNLVVAGGVLTEELDAELLSPKGLIKPAAFRSAHTALIDDLYRQSTKENKG
ncbi:AMP-binding protein [Microbacterium hydrocarbonoxydans]|uniref:Trans-feruloyl-CoA synthase n=1 Tax=Microbacterium hydrocarbonoxydans TaxID=273678 RepID=A0A1H4KTB4_9MICO|nr:AMP-binding protein [Microbacterium hydrocarbonoxydans]SEB61152.1 trans-feruloyl-CoA synthase [Microbacterium hydrocarbonoxydans]